MHKDETRVIGQVKDYAVLVEFGSEHIVVWQAEGDMGMPTLSGGQTVPGIAAFVKKAKRLTFGWGQFPDDGDEVIYLYDREDGNFGYAMNLDDPGCSEWGYAPF